MQGVREIKSRLEHDWIEFLRKNAARLKSGVIDGSSPPGIFVGTYGYPKVNVGPLIPLVHGDTSVMGKEEIWSGRTIEEIASYRVGLIRGTSSVRVSETSERYVRTLQELALSADPVEGEAVAEKMPSSESELISELRLSSNSAPFGPAIKIGQLRVGTHSSDQRIERAYYDGDLPAPEGLALLYSKGVPVSALHRTLSIGMLGISKKRKLVPTRWSITATDDTISRALIENMRDFGHLDSYQVASYSHMGNRYAALLFPDSPWRFELIEAWHAQSGSVSIAHDFEEWNGLRKYPSTAGAYFAARLAVAEYLNRIRKTCACLVLREVGTEYNLPLGVWQVREGLRSAFSGAVVGLDNLAGAISKGFSTLSISPSEVLGRSKLYDMILKSRKITDYF